MIERILAVGVITLFLSACKDQSTEPATSFYYWKTVFSLSDSEKEALLSNNVKKIYVRYFDVAMQRGVPAPVSPIAFRELPEGISIIPVVYIKNEVFKKYSDDDLSKKIVSYVDQISEKHNITYSEIQVDCDWTLSTKDAYFKFIKAIKRQSGKRLSATIRLHQVKYFEKTGIPEVDYGTLMYYNMGKISPDSSNSIYDSKTAHQYVTTLKIYPLTLNVALPVFSWGVHVRNKRVTGLLNKMDQNTFINDKQFEMKSPTTFVVKEDGFKAGRYFRKGDIIRIESVSSENLREIAKDLKENLREKTDEIIFFDLDSLNLTRYEKDIFKKTTGAF
ncbi:hypothetical protein WSM22_10280 [Cytophagales bacterium WSM2-2]|nr:hypothetical protein WSM22_10280 [Cytophagales bacterium WSM2-2]